MMTLDEQRTAADLVKGAKLARRTAADLRDAVETIRRHFGAFAGASYVRGYAEEQDVTANDILDNEHVAELVDHNPYPDEEPGALVVWEYHGDQSTRVVRLPDGRHFAERIGTEHEGEWGPLCPVGACPPDAYQRTFGV